MCINTYYILILYFIWSSVPICGVTIQDLPPDCSLITMKKTTLKNVLESIDILFKNKSDNYYFVQIKPASLQQQNQAITVTQTEATFFGDSIIIDNNTRRNITLKNTLYFNTDLSSNLKSSLQKTLHSTPIVKLYNDQVHHNDVFFIVTQSSYPNIRFSVKNSTDGNIEVIKEISKSFLLNYQNKHAVWAKKQIFNNNMLDIYIGFEFGAHSKSLLSKKDVYNFLVEKNIFSVPLLNNNVMPACFIEENRIAIYNDQYKKINIFNFTKTTRNNKSEGKIKLEKTIKLSEINHQNNINLNTFLLYKTPFKIDYDASKNQCILVYNDCIVKINANNKTFSLVIQSNYQWVIVDSIIDQHNTVYALWHNYNNNQWECTYFNT